ncbi:cobaltochelatase subunit CobN [Photobacterium sanctipauli]|uniref:Cobaltochelatase subunit CobN n=1 Tax=Photobacterium sanctipauli TaxID=1342794 RepID=A0A2T3NPJ0_9GAMM|nr:cobaltochelatase subunit CobN [Photobacterium sanctipauli]PSW18196.1 cobaltochelatase subunit CobN [Photobacterium sanctipauli]
MHDSLIKAAKLFSCFLSLFTFSVSATTVAIVHTDFVPSSKIERLTQYGQSQQVNVVSITPATFNLKQLADVDFVIADTPRMPDRQRLTEIMASLPQHIDWVMLGGGPPSASSRVEPPFNRLLMSYYLNGTSRNFTNLFAAIDARQQGESWQGLPKAERIPSYGIYHDESVVPSLSQYLNQKGNDATLPIIAFAISRNQIINQEFEPLEQLIEASKKASLTPVLYYLDDEHGLDWPWEQYKPAVVVNLTHLQQGDKRQAEMKRLNVPVIQTLHYRDGDMDDWRKSDVGIDQRSASVMLSTTETWGLTDPLVISADKDGDKAYIPEQLELLFGRAHAYHRLQSKGNNDKALAVMFWNAPPGAENISASNLNVPLSIKSIADGLKAEGFNIPDIDEQQMIADAKQLLSGYYNPSKIDTLYEDQYAAALPLRSYLNWYWRLPLDTQRFVNQWWGHPMKFEGLSQVNGEPSFVFPILKRGNLWLLPQPPRSGAVGHAIHSVNEPPNHLYLAVYLWLQLQHQNNHLDALVHLGTHGSQEWTPGKARGLSHHDIPYMTLGDLPVFYPYIQDNVAEAIQAKRRGRATIISHQTPTFGPAGLYGEYVALNSLLGDYQNALPGSVKDELKAALTSKMVELNVLTDIGIASEALEQDFEQVLATLEEHIDRLASSAVPLGLHVFGQRKSEQELLYTVLQQQGDELISQFEPDPQVFWKRFDGSLEALDQTKPVKWLTSVLEGSQTDDPALQPFAESAAAAFASLANNGELESLVNGLSGGFIQAGAGGDPLRNPSTTSGTNLFGFDPAKVPSPAAYQAAKQELQNLLDAHMAENGEYPQKVAFSLWAGETQRHFGMLEAQVLHALGLEPVWDRGGNLVDLKIIPAEELNRPRIDVVIQATSVYRDQFDGFMLKLSAAIEAISRLEDGNTVAQNSERLSETLRELGYESDKASKLSALRIFSNEPGDYGSGVNDLAIQSQDWESDDALGKQFTNRLQYAYGSEVWGEKLGDVNLFESQLESVDAAVMTRTSRLHGLLSTDHPFEYLGGLAAAVRNASGSSPSLYVNDLRQSEGRTVSADSFIAEELNAHYMNPVWIKAMQNEGYAGALNMLDITNNLFGWQATAPETVNDHQWEALSEVYIDDKHDLGINEWFEQHQPAAQMQIIERMLEAARKGYWDADEERLRTLIERHQALEPMVEYHQAHEVTQQYIEQTAMGFGLSGAEGQAPTEPVFSGQVMQEIPAFEAPTFNDRQMMMLILFVLLCIAAGAAKQHFIYREN